MDHQPLRHMSRKVGYWWGDKKASRFNTAELGDHLAKHGFQFVKLNLDKSFIQQGPFCAIIHKFSDILTKADSGDSNSLKIIESFKQFIQESPHTIVIDSIPNVRILLNRFEQYRIIQDSQLALQGCLTPPFAALNTDDTEAIKLTLKENNVKYPFVCKPLIAHGSSSAHQMCLVFSEKGLLDIKPPCVAQTFINHNAKLFKIFVINDKYFVVDRPSLKNFKAGEIPTLHFDSPDISKPNSSSHLTELDEVSRASPPVLKENDVRRHVQILRKILGLKLFGVDLIVENQTGRPYVIDMNIFPGYVGVDNHVSLIANMIAELVKESEMKIFGDTNSHPLAHNKQS
ncbi:inositol-tetrakisphosphate 1-kinase-like isoform X2 [Brevipalpus obovatus]|uniref:inositol-tetrakisphosphate 1-kinase-like isoform X2 n=1 Tax=Brevipalpus obovatus TaxID=246614 RepID=UPI003D9F41AE